MNNSIKIVAIGFLLMASPYSFAQNSDSDLKTENITFKADNIKIDNSKLKTVKVKKGVDKSITPKCELNKKLLLPKNSDKITYEYSFLDEVKAPVKKGDKLGVVTVYSGNKKISSIELKSFLL